VEAATGSQVWAERYDRTLTDIFAVQDDITRSIARALEVRLLHTDREVLARPPTGNVEAYNLYLRGLQLLRQDTKSAYERARRVFRHAVALDPTFARGLAATAECDCRLYLHCGTAVSMEEVLELAERAAALEPDLASAHAARGVTLLATGR